MFCGKNPKQDLSYYSYDTSFVMNISHLCNFTQKNIIVIYKFNFIF